MFDGNPDRAVPRAHHLWRHARPIRRERSALARHVTTAMTLNSSYEITMAFLTSGSCPGTYVRIWTATDDSGNESESAIQYVATVDTLAPEFDFCPDGHRPSYLDDNCYYGLEHGASTGMATVTDNCDEQPRRVARGRELHRTSQDTCEHGRCGLRLRRRTMARSQRKLPVHPCLLRRGRLRERELESEQLL